MRYEYTTNYADFQAAQVLNRRMTWRRQFAFYFWYWCMPCVGVVSLTLFIRDMAFHHFSYPAWAGGLLAGLSYLGIFPLLYRPFQIRKLYKQMKNGRPDDHTIEVEVTGEEMISRIPGFSEGRFLRAAIREFAEDERSMVLFISKRAFLMLPKRTLPEAAFVEVRAWLATQPAVSVAAGHKPIEPK